MIPWAPWDLKRSQRWHLESSTSQIKSEDILNVEGAKLLIDDYAKNGGPGEVWHLCSFYQDPLQS